MGLLSPTGNDDHAEVRLTASNTPAINDKLRDTRNFPEPTHLHLF